MPSLRNKIVFLRALSRAARRERARGKRIVFTTGCFDLLHAGHVTLLERAKRQGDLLVVGLNSDRSVRLLKGPGRPLVPQRDRARLLAALTSVDYVVIFDQPTPARVIGQLLPDVLIKGADWAAGDIVGAAAVRRAGGRVVRLPLVKGRSTSQLIARIRSRDSAHDPGNCSPATPIRSLERLLLMNLQRTKESLRTLEECARLVAPRQTPEFQRLRFRTYEIERDLLLKLATLRHH